MKFDISLIKTLISISSVFPNENRFAQFVEEWIKINTKTNKIESQKVEGDRHNLIITKGNGKKATVLLSGHFDTIPVVKGWKTDPFKAKISGERLYGLGAWDMKAGIYLLLQALKNFEPRNIKLKVAFCVDEENYSIGVHKLIDGGFCKDVDFIIVPEPGFIHGDKGITIGRAGRACFMVKIKGTSAHGSYPEKGINAINQARHFLSELEKVNFSSHKQLGNTKIYPRFIHSQAQGYSVPDECEIELDSKLVIPDTPETMMIKLKQFSKDIHKKGKTVFLPEIAFKQRPTPFCAPYEIQTNNNFVRICEKVLTVVNGKAKLFYRDSVADECIFAERLGVPVVTIGVSGGNAHAKNEFVSMPSIKRMQQVYLKILQEIDSQYD